MRRDYRGHDIGNVALKKLTNSIPIVFVLTADPVGAGFVDISLAPAAT